MTAHSVSILISTRNRVSSLKQTLDSLFSVQIPPSCRAELLIIDNGSSDTTPETARGYSENSPFPLKYLSQPLPGKSNALNFGMARAVGDIFLFSDDDLRFPCDWIASMCQPILDGRADLVQGGIRWAPGLLAQLGPGADYLPAIITSTKHKSSQEMAKALIGANMAFSRPVYQAVGNFNEDLGPGRLGLGEETLYCWKALQLGFKKTDLLSVEVEHHFDPARLTYKGILELAERKGRSLGYLDYHWSRCSVRDARLRLLMLTLKDRIRSLLGTSKTSNEIPPPWKYSYTANRFRLRQILVESQKSPLSL